MDKKTTRLRRAKKTRSKISQLNIARLTVHRTSKHIYAQILDENSNKVIAACSTLQKEIRESISYSGNIEAAIAVGKMIAEKAKSSGVEKVAFDRSGFAYHGRVKALANAAREAGLTI